MKDLSVVADRLELLASKIRLLALDSDGVLTDGSIYVGDDGTEFRRFNIKDGVGLKRLRDIGVETIVISGANSPAVTHRARTLGITEVYVGVDDKLALLLQICARLELTLDQVAYMGDDLPDLPVLERVGLACAPANAVLAVKRCTSLVTQQAGGVGAVRELCDLIFEAQQR